MDIKMADRATIREFPNKKIVEKKNKEIVYIDYTLIIVFAIIIVFGLIMVYSASYYEALIKFNNPRLYLDNQIEATVIGLVLMVITIIIPYKFWRSWGILPYIFSILMILLVIPFGVSSYGAKRWIDFFGIIRFQAVEPVKLGLIISMASFIEGYRNELKNWRKFIPPILAIILLAVLIYKVTNNLSSAIILVGIGGVMLFIGTKNYKFFGICTIIAMVVAVIGVNYIIKNAEEAIENKEKLNFREERLLAWKDLEKYDTDKGFQTQQGLYAIGSGGIKGNGLGKSVQKLGQLPEAQNDMIFPIICEEIGMIGGLSVIALFGFLIWRMYVIAMNAKDIQGSMLVIGVMAQIIIQVLLNIAVVTNTIPNTGISLPFFSYGGTSVAFLLIEMGLVFNVMRTIRLEIITK